MNDLQTAIELAKEALGYANLTTKGMMEVRCDFTKVSVKVDELKHEMTQFKREVRSSMRRHLGISTVVVGVGIAIVTALGNIGAAKVQSEKRSTVVTSAPMFIAGR